MVKRYQGGGMRVAFTTILFLIGLTSLLAGVGAATEDFRTQWWMGLIAGVIGVGCFAAAAGNLRSGVELSAQGLSIVGVFRTRRLQWAEIEGLQVTKNTGSEGPAYHLGVRLRNGQLVSAYPLAAGSAATLQAQIDIINRDRACLGDDTPDVT